MKSPDQSAGQPTFINYGNIGAIQTASNAVAHVQQYVGATDFGILADALVKLRASVPALHEIDSIQRERLVANISAAEAEIKLEAKDKAKLVTWLAGIGSTVQTLGSAQPAWEVVRAAARSVGLPL
jgi:hypothetical protein